MTSFTLKISFIFCFFVVLNLIRSGCAFKNQTDNEKHYLEKVNENKFSGMFEPEVQNTTVERNNLDNVTCKTLQKNGKPNNVAPSRSNKISIEENLHVIFKILQKAENTLCVSDMTRLLNGLVNNERWALKLFDALPKFPTGLLHGNMYQLGNFDECTSIKHINDVGNQFRGQYCLSHIAFKLDQNNIGFPRQLQTENEDKMNRQKFNSSLIHWGICLPSTCSPKDATFLEKEMFSSLIDFETLDILIEDKDCYYEIEQDISTGEIIYGCVMGSFLLFIILATVFHIWHIRKLKRLISYSIYNINSVREQKMSVTKEVILCFSLIQTVTKFLQTKPTDLNLECICGIKVLSMAFIIAGHSLIFIFGGPVGNVDFADKMTGRIENSIFMNGALLVDSFLLVSGFLMCRLLLIELEKRKGNINLLVLYIARYIRLTPAYLAVIGFYLTWLPKIGDGPLWKSVMAAEQMRCRKSWWTNLLYVNNYIQTDNLCMFQAWYLAADYHLFIIAPFLIYILWKWPKAGLTLLTIFTIGATILPGYITYRYDLDPTFLAFPPEIQDISTNSYFITSYIKTHMRASSYFLGLIVGYIVHEIQTNCAKISYSALWTGWILTVVFGFCSMCSIVLFLDPNYSYETIQSAIYAPLHRVVWASAVGWVIVVCVTDNAAAVNRFLSWKLFVPLSRLTYCSYLINGLVVISHKGISREAVSWTRLGLAFTIFGHLVTTIVFAFVLCICLESPIHGLEKILLRKKDSFNKPNQPGTILRVVEDNAID